MGKGWTAADLPQARITHVAGAPVNANGLVGIITPPPARSSPDGPKKRGKPEAHLQAACVRWLAAVHPRLLPLLRAGAEGGSRNRIEAANLKRTGVQAGWPDLHLADGRPGLWIELKAPGGRLSELQREKHTALRAAGYPVAVCYTVEEFATTITEYLKP